MKAGQYSFLGVSEARHKECLIVLMLDLARCVFFCNFVSNGSPGFVE